MFRKRGKRVLITRSEQLHSRLMVITICLALLVVTAGVALMSFGPSTSTAASNVREESPFATSSASVSATPMPSLTTPAAAPSAVTDVIAPVAEKPQVASSATVVTSTAPAVAVPLSSEPLTITYDRIGLQSAPVAQMVAPANGGVIEPPTDSQNPDVNFRPYWISSFGKPGKDANDTVYVVGHACTNDCWQSSWSVFNHLGEAQVGDRIGFQTQTGTVTYEVTKVIVNRKNVPEDKQDTWKNKPGEMRIIACYPADFDGKNVTVFGKLVQ